MSYAEITIGGDTYNVEYSAEFHNAEDHYCQSGWVIELESVKLGEWELEVLPLLSENQIESLISKIAENEI
jgi:hypothetical protein